MSGAWAGWQNNGLATGCGPGATFLRRIQAEGWRPMEQLSANERIMLSNLLPVGSPYVRTRPCDRCGKSVPWVAKAAHLRYCPECRRDVANERNRAADAKKKGKGR